MYYVAQQISYQVAAIETDMKDVRGAELMSQLYPGQPQYSHTLQPQQKQLLAIPNYVDAFFCFYNMED